MSEQSVRNGASTISDKAPLVLGALFFVWLFQKPHVTVPITSSPDGALGLAKKIAGGLEPAVYRELAS